MSATTPVQPSQLSPPLTQPPLDLTDQKANPCSLIPVALQDKYDLEGPGSLNADGATGPTCEFLRRTPDDPVLQAAVNTRSGGLEGLYQRRSNFEVFEPTEVGGYPGLFVQPVDDPGGCIIDVAANEDELILIGIRLGGSGDAPPGVACGEAREIISDVFTRVLS